ncbi:uncharacterized protein B0P05DRAFT_462896 [Gilbertella persicaria]|uniref:uncharacterized protein n=1 Tax=Gilbertella persicaria TaxID=101096 RepID=UPI00221FB6EA|nr:uncharacterized protein B0P05DRAFT_462896 [Gilbertella persicaria]KAI8091240.1 hypothetical protein B0P05DRAFT_462896 [Gilbertella persicaria]
MSDLDTYKANFKTSNKYLKYFCNQPASNWTLEKFKKTFYDKDAEKAKKAFIKNLNIVKHDAKNIPSVVKQHIDREINSFSSATRDITNITVKGNYYHISHKGKEKESEDVEFTQKWVEFLADAENNKNFHHLYREMKKQIGQSQSYDFGADMKEYIINVLNAVYMKRPSISRSEVVYNTIMIFPCLEAMLSLMKDNDFEPYFVPGEDELEAMTKQLKKMGGKGDKRKIYKADGVIRLAQEDDLEILVLETAGAFGHDDHAKAAFDNSKGMFASLAMLKTIADKYKFASVTEFKKLRLYLVQPSGKQ